MNVKSLNMRSQFGSMLDHKGQPCEGSFVFSIRKSTDLKMEKPASSTNNSRRGGKKSSETRSARTTSFYASGNSKSSLNLNIADDDHEDEVEQAKAKALEETRKMRKVVKAKIDTAEE